MILRAAGSAHPPTYDRPRSKTLTPAAMTAIGLSLVFHAGGSTSTNTASP